MITLLSDHNCAGQAKRIQYSLQKLGYADWLGLKIVLFKASGLPVAATDEQVWRFCQEHDYYLLTGNRSAKGGVVSLHTILDQLSDEKSLPVITIGNPRRVIVDNAYCRACAEAIVDIALYPEFYRGIPRLYIP